MFSEVDDRIGFWVMVGLGRGVQRRGCLGVRREKEVEEREEGGGRRAKRGRSEIDGGDLGR